MPLLGPIQRIFEQAPLFALVLMRIGGVMVLAPILGSATIPRRIKALIGLVLGMAVYPLVGAVAPVPQSWAGLALAGGGELLIGLTMGFIIMLMFTGIEVGAQMVGQQMGLSFARIVDPNLEISNDVLSQFYVLLVTLLYVLMNGHLVLIRALAGTFRTVPLLGGGMQRNILEQLVAMLTTAFTLGIRMAGPALIAIFLATIALGFISRTMPQLNILAAGFPVRITLALVLLVASMGSLCLLFQDGIVRALGRIGLLFA